MPRHVAIILDGNRRFAERRHLERSRGHEFGFNKLHETLEWCFDVSIETVTVYAFSIDNFKRPQQEVDALMKLAEEKLSQMLDHGELIRHFQVRVCVLGDLDLLPKALRNIVGRLSRETAGNTGPRLNLCFPYTSRHEMVCAAKRVIGECQGDAESITVDKFEKALFTGTDFPQLLIRTASQTRLSDFLLWQSGESQFAVYSCLWPEFTWWDFYQAILGWHLFRIQRKMGNISKCD